MMAARLRASLDRRCREGRRQKKRKREEKCAQEQFDRADIVIALGKAWKRRNRR
jgi:hypothetical protein